jgi:uncharacterized membrane protein YphA (DoxX/SURF4 family)
MPHLLSVRRIVAACLFLAHGTQKMFGAGRWSIAALRRQRCRALAKPKLADH